ncbi:hypothetical protein LZC95_17635 [Pendulispora brunnea]|uniref:DUF721 domain-containing protein n=1 Tax=Pendulispora brunnea TaxID=2905690 RepID=A0ABZ2KIX9_9BACT
MGENDQGERGGGGGSSRRRRLEGVIPDLIKRAVEIGVEKAAEAPDTVKHIMSELKLPKGMAGYVLAQIDETKNGVVRVVANEVRDFLEHTNLAGEAQKILTSLQFEVNTTIRFRPNTGARESRDGRDNGRDKREDSDAPSEDDESSGEEGPIANLPKPEVKTDIYVKREERRERRTRSKE